MIERFFEVATTIEEKEQRSNEAVEAGSEPARQTGPPRGLLREYLESGAVVLVMAVFFMTFVAKAAVVPSASMENTIYVGDRFLVNMFIFAPGPALPFLPQREIRRGDIIVFKYPAKNNVDKEVVQYKTLFIKRVIGLPGETVEVKGPDVYIDGKLLPEYRVTALDVRDSDKSELKKLDYPRARDGEPYTVYYRPETIEEGAKGLRSYSSGFQYAVSRPYKIPADSYFVMGDNRDNSADSRVWGTVPRSLVVGRAMFVIWSYDEAAQHAEGRLGFLSDFFNNTRWGRIGTLLR
ncbi:MAG: signal peptidase [Acidobacteriota bacterium]|nr:signal peptidase [Acidobacteriota bacterium]